MLPPSTSLRLWTTLSSCSMGPTRTRTEITLDQFHDVLGKIDKGLRALPATAQVSWIGDMTASRRRRGFAILVGRKPWVIILFCGFFLPKWCMAHEYQSFLPPGAGSWGEGKLPYFHTVP
ncbi:hypothetical protein Vretimale_19040 [Volvox reticuliferus]|uniref:Uncharacterized protein n=1 Tax=Volvox reticuliferus TaxID=1737510 RepID=A0A8J4LYT1_9CHLO|nr:hypothetical protein Vretimale_19040 [Volvox reticuliferus]